MMEDIFWGAFGGIAFAWIIQGFFNRYDEWSEIREDKRKEAKEEEWRIYQANKNMV